MLPPPPAADTPPPRARARDAAAFPARRSPRHFRLAAAAPPTIRSISARLILLFLFAATPTSPDAAPMPSARFRHRRRPPSTFACLDSPPAARLISFSSAVFSRRLPDARRRLLRFCCSIFAAISFAAFAPAGSPTPAPAPSPLRAADVCAQARHACRDGAFMPAPPLLRAGSTQACAAWPILR